MRTLWLIVLGYAGVLLLGWPSASPGDEPAADPYRHYVETASEFRTVRHDASLLTGRWDRWVYMPWRFKWTIGTGEPGGQFCRDYGIRGGFTDHGDGPIDWLEHWGLRFYNDHTAGKGDLYIHPFDRDLLQKLQRDPRAVRRDREGPRPIDAAMRERLRKRIRENLAGVSKSPMRAAYALDDEVSWGTFVTPLAWRIHEDDDAYRKWLGSYHGKTAPRAQFVTYDDVRGGLDGPLECLDLSPLLDRLTYNDSVWADLLGELVEYANSIDPETPCGFVGGQSPNAWGGYDYAKLARKVQFIEAYDLGSSFEIMRSLAPPGLPMVTTHFHDDKRGIANDVWQSWTYFARGARGMIGWVDGWFDGEKPRPWLDSYKATLREISDVQSPKLAGARRLHDGVAIYYSHPSIQVSWCLDAQAHGKTWINRNNDHRLGTSHNVRKAWEYLLADSGVAYDFLAYDRVIREGVPAEYRVLVLPACFAISDAEAERIAEFCRRGGVVVADFACGLFDQHGKGRTRGALDDLFGVSHAGSLTKADFFGGKLWVETDQDAAYNYRRYRELFDTVKCRLEGGFAVAEHQLDTHQVREVGRGKAVYLNLSPQRYLQYREEGSASDAHRRTFLAEVLPDGKPPRVIVQADDARPRDCETIVWSKGDRLYVFLVQNAPATSSPQGGGGVDGLPRKAVEVDVQLRTRARDVVDERSGRRLGDVSEFRLNFPGVEPAFFSWIPDPADAPKSRE